MKRIIASIALLILACTQAIALQIESYDIQNTVLFIVNTEGLNSAPTPILWAPGGAINIPISGIDNFYWRPDANLFWNYYLWDSTLKRALPAEIEHRSAIVVGLILDSPLSYDFPIGDKVKIEVGAGPAFVIRASFLASVSAGDVSDAKPQVAPVGRYFYDKGRWFYPETSLSFLYKLSDKASFGLSARVYYPVFHLWDKMGLSFTDELMASGSIFARFMIGK
jgi:hypothetical protein